MLNVYYKIANVLRTKRFRLFLSLLERTPRPIRILDVGGTQSFWEQMGFANIPDIQIVLLNITKEPVSHGNFTSVVGDARSLDAYADKEFDIAFSNSVIEHVGTFTDQQRMAQELRRVGKRYFLQTPYRYFPIEPHFIFPGFQFLPVAFRIWLITHFALGCFPRFHDREAARRAVDEIRLLSRNELRQLFPEGTHVDEKFLGLTKSLMVYEGWDHGTPR